MLFLVLSSPALRVAPPVMQLRGGVPFAPQQAVAPVSAAPGGTAGFVGGVVPTPPGAGTLQQKVETLRTQLNLASGQTLAETIASGVQTIGLEADVKSLNMLQTVDACLQTIGAAPATEPAVAAPQEGQEQGQGLVRVRRGPPPLGYGDSYEGAMFGDYGYGGSAAWPNLPPAVPQLGTFASAERAWRLWLVPHPHSQRPSHLGVLSTASGASS